MYQAQIDLAPVSEPRDLPRLEKLNPWVMPAVLLLSDISTVILAGVLAVILRGSFSSQAPANSYEFVILSLTIFATVFWAVGLYSGIIESAIAEFKTLVQASSIAYLVVLGAAYLTKQGHYYSRAAFLLGWALTVLFLPLSRSVIRHACCTRSWWATPAVIIGSGRAGREILALLQREPSIGLRPVAFLDEPSAIEPRQLSGVTWGDLSLARHFAAHYRPCLAIVAMPERDADELAVLIQEYADKFQRVWVIQGPAEIAALGIPLRVPAGGAGFELNQHHRRLAPQVVKRCFDLALALPIFMLLSPLLLAIAILTRLTSKGPVFYGQRRIGRNGREFIAWKFRTMVQDADRVLEEHLRANPELRDEWDLNHKLRDDPRITPIGKVLRKFSLDEFPQLWNVLCGEMSIVGPRPIVRSEADKYGRRFALYQRVPPGITGLWQISGRNNTTYDERVRLDEYYVRHWSMLLDLYILLRTVKTVVSAEGAY